MTAVQLRRIKSARQMLMCVQRAYAQLLEAREMLMESMDAEKDGRAMWARVRRIQARQRIAGARGDLTAKIVDGK